MHTDMQQLEAYAIVISMGPDSFACCVMRNVHCVGRVMENVIRSFENLVAAHNIGRFLRWPKDKRVCQ